MPTTLTVNQRVREVEAAPDTPLLYVLAGDLELQGPRFGCGLAQCGSCSVLVDGVEVRSCVTPLSAAAWLASDAGLVRFDGIRFTRTDIVAGARQIPVLPPHRPVGRDGAPRGQ